MNNYELDAAAKERATGKTQYELAKALILAEERIEALEGRGHQQEPFIETYVSRMVKKAIDSGQDPDDSCSCQDQVEAMLEEIYDLRNALENAYLAPAVPDVDAMVGAFLSWRLPDDFAPDAGISFDPVFNKGTQWEMRYEPSGTNLLNCDQAKAMVLHMLAATPQPPAASDEKRDADRYRWLRDPKRDDVPPSQYMGVGTATMDLRGDALDAAIDAMREGGE